MWRYRTDVRTLCRWVASMLGSAAFIFARNPTQSVASLSGSAAPPQWLTLSVLRVTEPSRRSLFSAVWSHRAQLSPSSSRQRACHGSSLRERSRMARNLKSSGGRW